MEMLISGKIASKIIVEAFEKNDFSETVLSKYHTELYDEVGDEQDELQLAKTWY